MLVSCLSTMKTIESIDHCFNISLEVTPDPHSNHSIYSRRTQENTNRPTCTSTTLLISSEPIVLSLRSGDLVPKLFPYTLEIILTNMRIGHTRATHGFLFTRSDPLLWPTTHRNSYLPTTKLFLVSSVLLPQRITRKAKMPSLNRYIR